MSGESRFIESLRALAADPAARGLLDDAAILPFGDRSLVLTHDQIAEGVHYLPDDPPADIAWKLVAVNLSDLAAKGARPIGILLGYSLGEAEWDQAFATGLGLALSGFGLSLLGGDTVKLPPGAPRLLSATAIGEAGGPIPDRRGAAIGDHVWVSGSIGDAGGGLALLRDSPDASGPLVERYRQPRPRLEAGQRLAPLVSAMMDVSDGLLVDLRRLAHASSCRAELELDAVPMSPALISREGEDRTARLRASTAGDDYELLFTVAADRSAEIRLLGEEIGLPFTQVGAMKAGAGLRLRHHGEPIEMPERLGFEHGE